MESKIYSDIQKQLIYMIPEKWDKIALYATVDKNMSGELFFYYIPKSIVKEEAVNCYEIPQLFGISESEYLELLTGIYNKIKILKQIYLKEYNKNWTNLTISINEEAFKIVYFYEDIEKYPFNSYERHLIWRRENLDMLPVFRADKKVLERYDRIKDTLPKQFDVRYEKREKTSSKNVVNYERVLTAEEIIAQATKKQKIKSEKVKKDKKNIKENNKIAKERKKQEKELIKRQKERDKERRKAEREVLGKKGLGLFDKEHKNRLPDE